MDWEHLPSIKTPRLLLRSITDHDVDDVFTVFSDPQVMRYWSTPPLANKEAAAALIAEIQASFSQQQALKWGIALPSDNRLIGTAALFHPDFTHRRSELGYALGREHWGQGYMQEALKSVLDYAFNTLEFHRIEADADPRNAASLKTLERLGFQREGYLRERWQVGGEIQDAVFYGLLKRDWETVKLST